MKLDNGQRLPDLTLQTVDESEIQLPADVDDGWASVLFYGGHW